MFIKPMPRTYILMAAATALAALLSLDADRRPPARARIARRRAQEPGGHVRGGPGHAAQHATPPADTIQPSQGHHARKPSQIPSRGWWSILKRTLFESMQDRLLTEAAGVTFYTLLALFPGIAALVSLYGLFADPSTIGSHLEALRGVVPGGGMQIIEEQITRIVSKGTGELGFSALIGLAISLWSSNQAAKALFDALNVVYEEREKRSFVWLTVVTLSFTLGGILFALFAMALVVVLPVLLNQVGLGSTAETLLRLLRWPLLLGMVIVLLAALYRFGPSREQARWSWVSWGGAVAALIWLAGSIGFSWYVENFGNYNETYGSLGAAIGFMTWIWISSAVVLLGAELNAEMERQTARDTTTGPEMPMGERGARMADTVATS